MRMPDAQHLIGQIYDAAQCPAGWAEVFASMQQQLGLDGWNLLRLGEQRLEVVTAGGERVSDSAAQRYEAYYHRIDPRLDMVRHAPAGTLCCDQHHFDERFVARSEFYQDFLRPEGLRYVLGASITPGGSQTHGGYLLGLLRGPERGVFEEAHQIQLTQWLPHLQRALQLMEQISGLQARTELLEAAGHHSGQAALALDSSGLIHQHDRQADNLLRAGHPVRSREGRLCSADARQQAALQTAIERCARTGDVQSLRLPGHSLTLSPLRSRTLLGALHGPLLLCLIAPLTSPRLPAPEQLVALFGLTAAEARLACAIASGASLDDYAEQHGVRLSTVKTQLQAVFAKTDTHRQNDLTRLVCAVPAP